MAIRIEIASKQSDSRATVRKKKLQALGFDSKIQEVTLVDVYTIDKKLSKKELSQVAEILTNPVTQHYSFIHFLSPRKFTYAIEIGYLPGVTDNVATTAKEMIEDLLKRKFIGHEQVYTSQITFIDGKIRGEEVKKITDTLYNPLIQRAKILSSSQFQKNKGMGVEVPRVKIDLSKKVDEVNLEVSDEELAVIGKAGIKSSDGTRRGPLALDLTFMKAIRDYFKKKKRHPTDMELESIAQTWSEHCKHTIFADPIDEIKQGLFKIYIQAATEKIRKKKGKKDICVSVFQDNSGAIVFDEQYLVTDKVETHNSPSALDPFGGSITGIVGVNRDAIGFGLGAKPIVNRYGFCFADPLDTKPLYKGANLTQKMLSPRRIMNGVIDGVNSGGNCSGIPTPQGFVVFNDGYKGKPLVFVGTLGLIPKKISGHKTYEKKARPGDYVVMIGGRVGQDGIHGATFSSESMDSGSPATAVQIGDPITQKKLSDALVKEARDLDLYNSVTDNGAGGLSCSVAEMAKESGGCFVKLDDVPLKYPGLSPWQIWVSESQERMTSAVPKKKWKKFAELMERRGVEATIIGQFNDSGDCVVKYQGKKIMDVDMKFLHDGLPKRPMITTYAPPHYPEPQFSPPKNLTKILLDMLSRQNIASFEFISQQYDHEVQGGAVLKPLQGKGRVNADASIMRPVLNSQKGVVISQALHPWYSAIDTYHMAACSIDAAIRQSVAAGADIEKLALLDNFCWCSSTEAERLGQLKRAAKACYDYALVYETPFISGKDSMFNDFKGYDHTGKPVKISVPPTLLISTIGVIDDSAQVVSLDLKFPGDLLYVLGETNDELGASEYYQQMSDGKNQYVGNSVPQVNAQKNIKRYKAFHKAVEKGLVVSAISVNRGGLAAALAKTAMAGQLGIEVSLKKALGKFSRDDYGLFSESQGRMVVSINPKNKFVFEKVMQGTIFTQIGKVRADGQFVIKSKNGRVIVKTNVKRMLKEYKKTFRDY